MSRPLSEIETLLQQMIVEHQKLLGHVVKHQAAMKAFNLRAMEDTAVLQEAGRLRIAALETKRQAALAEFARQLKLEGPLTITRLGELFPPARPELFRLRGELKKLIQEISARTHVGSRLAGAVLGHLNMVVRLLAGAVEKAGLYTKQGVPKVSARIGVMEAVG